MSLTRFSRRCFSAPVAGLGCLALLATLSSSGCATTNFIPQVVARGEITLRYDRTFELVAGHQHLTNGITYKGLANYVRCVPEAAQHARAAESSGRGAIALSVLGGVIGLSGFGGLYGLHDQEHLWSWLLGGIAMGVIGTTLGGISHRLKNHANGHAIDAVNYYNDAVGSLGATCDDLSYPGPVGPAPALVPVPTDTPVPSSAPASVLPPAPPLPPPPLAPPAAPAAPPRAYY